jgi:hypothetical protein
MAAQSVLDIFSVSAVGGCLGPEERPVFVAVVAEDN